MKEIELSSIDPSQIFKIFATIILIGVVIGSFILSLYALVVGGWQMFLKSFIGVILFSTLLPLAYGAAAALIAFLYNFVAKKVGGFKITLNIEDK